MANHKSAEKRHRQSLVRRDRNRAAKSAVRSAIRKAADAARGGDAKNAKLLLVEAERLVAKAAVKGIYHRKNASRKISRLATLVAHGPAKTVAAPK